MNQILCPDWLLKWVRWSGAISPAGDCLIWSRKKNLLWSWLTKVFVYNLPKSMFFTQEKDLGSFFLSMASENKTSVSEEYEKTSHTSGGCHSLWVLLATLWSLSKESLRALRLYAASPLSRLPLCNSSMTQSWLCSSLRRWYSSAVIFSESTASFLRWLSNWNWNTVKQGIFLRKLSTRKRVRKHFPHLLERKTAFNDCFVH